MLTRRIFLRGSAIAMAGMGEAPMWLARAAAAEGRKRKTLVAIFMRGAADGLNIVVPFGDSRYRELRPNLALQAPRKGDENENNGHFGSVIDLDGMFGLNPGLRPLKAFWDKKQLAIVEATGSPDPSRSHFDAQDYMESGTPGKTGNGWLNRALGDATPDSSPLRAVALSNRVPRTSAGRTGGDRAGQCSGFQYFRSGPAGDSEEHVFAERRTHSFAARARMPSTP